MPVFWLSSIIVIAGIVLIGIATLAICYTKEITASRKRLGALGSQVIETGFGRIEYARRGIGLPVLVIHGAMGGFDQGLWATDSLDRTKYEVISISRFGYLRSPVPEKPDLNAQADVYAGMLNTLGIRQVAVFGISAGSTSAIRFAARYPERTLKLILLGPDAPGDNYMSVPPKHILETLLRSDFLYWLLFTFFGKRMQKVAGLVPAGFVMTKEYDQMVKTIQLSDLPVSERVDGMILECYASLAELQESVTPSSPYPLSKIKTPTLVINSADDPISIPENVRRLAEQLPNMRLFVLPDGGHFFFGHREDVQYEITQFLDRNLIESE